MKRFGIATVILLAVLAADVFGGESRRAPRPPVHIQLIASDAPGWMHTGGPPSRYLCPATNAEVQMQAAVDACSAAGGGVIEASEGTFLVSKPAGAVDVTISSAALKADAPVDGVAGPLTLYTLTYGTGAHTNVSVGQIYRVTGGTGDTSGNSIETQEEWLNATVMRKNAANTNVTTATWTDATNTLTEVGAFASYTYAAGDLIFISGGTNATVGWYTIASRVSDDAITTDTDIDDGAGDLAAGDITGPDAVGLSETMLEDYTGVVATRLIAAVVLKPQVSIVGSGQYVTYIKLADQQNCDVIHTEAGATFVYAAMEKLTIDGNKANQGDEVATSFNGECNGIVLNEYGIDLYFRDVSVVSCKGDGWGIGSPWGTRLDGGWTEGCIGTGIIFMNRSVTSVWGHKVQGNSHAIRLRNALGTLISNCHLEVDNVDGNADNNTIQLLNQSSENTFTGNWIGSKDATAGANADCVYVKYGTGNTFTGNYFYVDGTKKIFTGGAAATDYANSNVIVGNVFRAEAGVTYNNLRDAYQNSHFANNYPSRPSESLSLRRMKNTSGGNLTNGRVVVMKAAALDEIEYTTTVGDSKVVGVMGITTGDGAWGMVRTRGWTKYLKVNGEDAKGGDIAIGDLLCTHDEAGVARKAATGEVAFAKALEAYAGEDSNGLVDALIIAPRQVE